MSKYITLILGLLFSFSSSAQLADNFTFSSNCLQPFEQITSDDEFILDFTFTPSGSLNLRKKVKRNVRVLIVSLSNPTVVIKTVNLGTSNLEGSGDFKLWYTELEGLRCGDYMLQVQVGYRRVSNIQADNVIFRVNGVEQEKVYLETSFTYADVVSQVYCFNYVQCPTAILYPKFEYARTEVRGCYNTLEYSWAIDGDNINETNDRTKLLCGTHHYSVTITDPNTNCDPVVESGNILYDGCEDPFIPCTTDEIDISTSESEDGILLIDWNDINGAVSYQVTVTPSDPECCGGNSIPVSTTYNVTVSEFRMSVKNNSCFSYEITPICANGDKGKSSGKQCRKPMFKYSSRVDNIDLNSKVNIFPNPAADYLNVQTEDVLEKATISIYDMNGRQVLERNFKGTSLLQIETSDLNPGTYILKLSENEILHSTKKIFFLK